jgi:hypothetical protein
VQSDPADKRIMDSPALLVGDIWVRESMTRERTQIMDIIKAEMKLEPGKGSNSISIKLHGSWYHSLCTSASRPRPPIKAYFNWGKSFYELFSGHRGKNAGRIGTHHGNGNITNIWQEPRHFWLSNGTQLRTSVDTHPLTFPTTCFLSRYLRPRYKPISSTGLLSPFVNTS